MRWPRPRTWRKALLSVPEAARAGRLPALPGRGSSEAEQAAHNRCVAGSNPAPATSRIPRSKKSARSTGLKQRSGRSQEKEQMAKQKFERTKPHVNIGTIGHIDHG